MRIGITGTREGMTSSQRKQVYDLLDKLNLDCRTNDVRPEFHHGDCVGVDVEAAEIAKSLGYTVISHPGPPGDLQAFHSSDEVRPNLTHFKRNRNIVDETDLLIVVPLQTEWQSKGGTWYTHDYALKNGRSLMVFYPEK